MTWEICAVAKHEARYIMEWLAYHKVIGCSHVHLYEGRGDHTADIIEPYIKEGFVTMTPWLTHPGQHAAYRDFIINHKARNPWTLICDVDEYLVPMGDETVNEVLSTFGPEIASIGVGWHIFGHAGRLKRPLDHQGSTLKNYTRCPDYEHHYERFTKSFIKPAGCAQDVHDPHFFEPLPNFKSVREDGSQMHFGDHHHRTQSAFPTRRLRLNHYFTRSLEDYVHKLWRGCADGAVRSMDHFINHNEHGNECEDLKILEYFPALHAEMIRVGAWSQ